MLYNTFLHFGGQANSMNKNVLENCCLSAVNAGGIYGRKSGTGLYFSEDFSFSC
jgi:hypothetical protein